MGKEDKNGEKPKIQITDSVKIGIHSTVFSVGESPNLKPSLDYFSFSFILFAVRLTRPKLLRIVKDKSFCVKGTDLPTDRRTKPLVKTDDQLSLLAPLKN